MATYRSTGVIVCKLCHPCPLPYSEQARHTEAAEAVFIVSVSLYYPAILFNFSQATLDSYETAQMMDKEAFNAASESLEHYCFNSNQRSTPPCR